MDCVNHSGVSATAYCQNCGKALCPSCVRNAPAGQIFCEPCLTAWQGMQQPFVAPPAGAPSPGLAAFLGLIPGVGAMYNGQFIKGLIHVAIFAVLVSAAHIYGIFGLFIAGWVCYQVFEAYHTAKARRDGEPLPDPLGLNEIGNLFATGGRGQPGAGAGPAGSYQAPYQPPYQAPYQGTYTPPPPGFTAPGVPPPVPPVPPMSWRRREPVGAVILIALGLLFLLGQMNWFSGRMFELSWPVLLIGVGVWLIVNRMRDSQGGSK
ncbi:MAG: B-box zinc finger protein [Terracidiphilus sp.]